MTAIFDYNLRQIVNRIHESVVKEVKYMHIAESIVKRELN